MRSLRAVPLKPGHPEDVVNLQALLDVSSYYSTLVEDGTPGLPVAQQLFHQLPQGKEAGDKLVLGIYDGVQLVGCVDIIRGFPEAHVAYLGLLFFREADRGQGLGAWALQVIDGICAGWHCTELRLAVAEVNRRAYAFWQREGFTDLYRMPSGRGGIIVMERCNGFAQRTS